MNKTSVLLLLQGWGLSASWQRNAIMSAKTPNFNNLWQNYEHKVLQPMSHSGGLTRDPYYRAFFNNVSFKNNLELSNEAFANRTVTRSVVLKKLFGHILQHSSKLHLFLTVSSQNKFGNVDHLAELVRLAKANGVFRIKIHIFVDDLISKEVALAQINSLEKNIKEAGLEVTTIHPLSAISDNAGISATLNMLIDGKGKRVLSPNQAFTISRQNMLENGFIVTSDSNSNISDFDGILFCDHTGIALSPLLDQFNSTEVYRQRTTPKYLEVCSLLGESDKSSVIPKLLDSNFLSQTAGSGKNGILISDLSTIGLITALTKLPSNIQTQGINSSSQSISNEMLVKSFFAKLFSEIKIGHDLIIADLSSIYYSGLTGQFEKVAETIKLIDDFLPDLELCIMENGGILNISSFYGMAEHLDSVKLPIGEVFELSTSPLPLITVSPEHKHSATGNFSISDLLSSKSDLELLKKFILPK